ncbi:hypothetical protein ACLPJF_27560 [Pseudomonas vlassakiae]|jgi:hypothetical protein|uniref:hypothetical protein n=1 Tax=Pseudomonas vlassakiae TaxID=485888 RepID=UPI003D2691CC
MLKPQKKLNLDTLETLLVTGAAREFVAGRNPAGKWVLQVRVGTRLLALGSQRLDERLFGSLDSLSAFAEGLGIRSLQVEL